METEHERLRKTREDHCNLELASCTNALASREREQANKEKRLAEKELQELAGARKKMEEL
jgi:hypothetical protein